MNFQQVQVHSDVALTSWRTVAKLYQSYFTGLVLYVSSRHGPAKAAALTYEVFCQQRQERFLPGLRKLGIDGLPHAVAAAQYHYLSNHIGGVPVQYMYESDRKAWIRYPAPRWIWSGTALCGIPPEVSRAMLAGWHAQNGVSLNNPRLGFVCTKQAVDGQSGLEGYYFEYDRDLEPQERLRFARDEDAPDFDSQAAPVLPTADWPLERLAKASRNYAMEYVRSAMVSSVNVFGPAQAEHVLKMTGQMIGMQFYHEIARDLGVEPNGTAEQFACFVSALCKAQGDDCELIPDGKPVHLLQKGWGQMRGLNTEFAMITWKGLLGGMLDAHNHRLELKSVPIRSKNAAWWQWNITTTGSAELSPSS